MNKTLAMDTCRVLAIAAGFLAPAARVAAQRPAAPYGYIVTYGSRDGKLLSDGKQFRIAIVTRDYGEATRTFNNYNRIHMYKAVMKDLQTEADYKAALELQKDPKTGLPKEKSTTDTAKRSENGKVSGSSYKANGTTFRFKSDGSVTTNYGTSGRWSQNGNTVTWTIADGGFSFRYTGTVSSSGEMMTIYSSTYNPRTNNEGTKSLYGTGRRVP